MRQETLQIINNTELTQVLGQNKFSRIRPEYNNSHLAEIGRIVVNFARLEDFLKQSISTLMDVEHPLGQIATVEASFRELVSMLGVLCIHKFDDTPEVRVLIRAVQQAEHLRNQMLHSLWVASGDEILRKKWTAKPNKGVDQVDEWYTVEDLVAISKWLGEVGDGLSMFFQEKTMDPYILRKLPPQSSRSNATPSEPPERTR